MRHIVLHHVLLFALIVLVLGGCSGSKDQEIKTAEDRFKHAKQLYDDGDYLEAIQQFEIIKLQFQGSSISDQAQYFTGMSRFHRGELILGVYDFELLIKNYPSSPLVPDAYCMIAQCYVQRSPKSQLDQSYTYRALDALQTFIELYPTHTRVPDAQKDQVNLINKLAQKEYETGMLYEKMENTKAALIYYDRVLDQYYSTQVADDALFAKINIMVRRKKWDEVRKLVEYFLTKFPDSPFRGDVEQIRELIPNEHSKNGFLKADKMH